jgi:hypothetical protein
LKGVTADMTKRQGLTLAVLAPLAGLALAALVLIVVLLLPMIYTSALPSTTLTVEPAKK